MTLDLSTPEACVAYVRKTCRELALAEHDYQAWQRQADPSDEVAIVQMAKAINRLRDGAADAIHLAARRLHDLQEAPRADA